ncbi:MAG: hypothetical protein AB1742_01940, partial [bacterium]
MILLKNENKIIIAFGFHVNCNHSYRGDRNDWSGFGHDTAVIRQILKTLDEANERGLDARGVWDFDNFWSLENCVTRYAPDVLERIKGRVADGRDEVILGSWCNGLTGCMTDEEFDESMKRTITNDAGSGIRDVFGCYSPIVRPQEAMFTQGSIELYRRLDVRAVCLYYSAVPFDAFRNFVPVLTPAQRHNPLILRSTESDESILVIPTYNQGDVLDNLSFERWLLKIRRWQETGKIPGNALVYLNMDADAEIWTGGAAPSFLRWLPNVRGMWEFIEAVNRHEYAQFGRLGDYIEENAPAGELRLTQDTADGSFSGYGSWSEKAVNYRLWRIAERARWFERLSAAGMAAGGTAAEKRRKIEELLYGRKDSYFESRLRVLSTTHFGLASPVIHPERLRVAFHFARTAYDRSREALDALSEGVGVRVGGSGSALARFRILAPRKYDSEKLHKKGVTGDAVVEASLPRRFDGVSPGRAGLEGGGRGVVDFDVIKSEPDGWGGTRDRLYIRVSTSGAGWIDFSLMERDGAGGADSGGVVVSENGLAGGEINVRLGGDGGVESLVFAGEEFACVGFLT